jgi:hypothetical protein
VSYVAVLLAGAASLIGSTGLSAPHGGSIGVIVDSTARDRFEPGGTDDRSAAYDPANKPTLGHAESIRYFSVDVAGNEEPTRQSAAAQVDTQAPTTNDDVAAAPQSSPVTVTLSATDSGGSGLDKTYYTIGETPAAPTTSSSLYDPANKPALDNGQRIRYFSTDRAGNTEAARTSLAAAATAPPAPGAAAVLCGKPIVLTDVTLRGRNVRLGGVTRVQ